MRNPFTSPPQHTPEVVTAARIVALRLAHKLHRRDLAASAQISIWRLAHIEAVSGTPVTLAELTALAHALGTRVAVLIGEEPYGISYPYPAQSHKGAP